MQPEKTIDISKSFFEIYRNFNVTDQIQEMKSLEKRELYLLLTLCLDKFSDEDPVVRHNLIPFREEIMEIFDIQDDKEPSNPLLINLINETGDKYIETDFIHFEAVHYQTH